MSGLRVGARLLPWGLDVYLGGCVYRGRPSADRRYIMGKDVMFPNGMVVLVLGVQLGACFLGWDSVLYLCSRQYFKKPALGQLHVQWAWGMYLEL